MMQNEVNTTYSGLEELLAAENYRKNYNEFIVNNCLNQIEISKRFVDFGAGIGTLSILLKKKLGKEPICVEIDKNNIEYLKNRNLEHFKNIDDVKESIDLVFSSNVLEHIEDDISILKSIQSKLNKNGFLYLYLPANMILWSKVDNSVGHYRRYSRSEIKKKLNLCGFEVQSIYYADSVGFMAILVMKLFKYNTDKVIESPSSLKFYDRFIFPLSRFLDSIGLKFLFGKNLIVVGKKLNN
jgi:SAM-dependent methyltransferase